jgi:hypothetical protein
MKGLGEDALRLATGHGYCLKVCCGKSNRRMGLLTETGGLLSQLSRPHLSPLLFLNYLEVQVAQRQFDQCLTIRTRANSGITKAAIRW